LTILIKCDNLDKKGVEMLFFSVILTVVSFVVHFSTYFGIFFFNEYYGLYNLAYIINFLIIIPFGFMIFKLISSQKQNKNNDIVTINNKNPFSVYIKLLKKLLPDEKDIIYGIIILLLIYSFINFFISFYSIIDGTPVIDNGKYFQNNHGVFTEITKEVYVQLKYTMIKMYSGFWILFSLLSMLYFRKSIKNSKLNVA
jgi:hypothetical protein